MYRQITFILHSTATHVKDKMVITSGLIPQGSITSSVLDLKKKDQ